MLNYLAIAYTKTVVLTQALRQIECNYGCI
ncbi:MAG: hypothetical protein CLLPBCKN_001443 [Chroococcidiopsis cubana SAG 39.79]|nr:hypothetical protein [Chroococcidiopsis cubana SAG 39.79]